MEDTFVLVGHGLRSFGPDACGNKSHHNESGTSTVSLGFSTRHLPSDIHSRVRSDRSSVRRTFINPRRGSSSVAVAHCSRRIASNGCSELVAHGGAPGHPLLRCLLMSYRTGDKSSAAGIFDGVLSL